MTAKKTPEPETVADDTLDTAAGGFEAWPSISRVNGFDGKTNDISVEELTFVHEGIRRVK